ncbi:MAG: hypothetical protein KF699_12615 [Phycisphaeraceae bacterium]|nr:hypothetical protein [Phycisphaeraceae bacterium]
MTTHELLELASLDALGLLDADERESFERAFRAAAPAVQAQIRREQLRAAVGDELLPAVEAPPGLRARVLAAVREAITGSFTVRRISGGAVVPELRPVYGVHRIWRIGAIGCAAAAIVLGFTTLQLRTDYRDIRDGLSDHVVRDAILKDFSSRFSVAMFDPTTRFVQFAPEVQGAEPAFAGKALLVLDPDARTGQLFVKDLPSGGAEFELIVEDESGNVTTADITFRPSSPNQIERRDLDHVATESGRSLGIRHRGTGSVVLRSIRL